MPSNSCGPRNTDSDGGMGSVYFLVAGRWFSAPDFTGPWTFATPNLSDDFKRFPEHQRSRVRASVPGTTQAIEAVLLAEIPQTARVSRTVMAPEVDYQGGAPQFEPIEDDRRARGQHRQGHPQGRRPLLHVLPGRLVPVEGRHRPVEGDRHGAEAVYEIPVSSPPPRSPTSPSRNRRRRRRLCDGDGLLPA